MAIVSRHVQPWWPRVVLPKSQQHHFFILSQWESGTFPSPLLQSLTWSLCTHTSTSRYIAGRDYGALPLSWLYFCVACCRTGRRWSVLGWSLCVMGSSVLCHFYLWHHPFMACLDKKQYSESPQDTRSSCCNPATDFDGLLLPSPSSCRDEVQPASTRTRPELLVAWILLMAYANSKFRGTQDLRLAQSKGQSPRMETRCCPSAASGTLLPTSTLAPSQAQVLMICWTCASNINCAEYAYHIWYYTWSCHPGLIFQRSFLQRRTPQYQPQFWRSGGSSSRAMQNI